MRPTRLELEGFISFRERTEIDFKRLDLFGVTGPTGAGKTSLIDSMIFALFGKTPRLGEKAVQELITQGSDQLKVLLEFRSGDRLYRVLRIVKRRGAGRVQIERLDGNEWTALASSSRELRDRIEDIIGLDFEGFTRTVVLPQGQFDRFLRGDGAARRKILSDLLGLDVYEKMMKRANEIARDARHQSDVLTEVIEQQYGQVSQERLAAMEIAIVAARKERQAVARELAGLDKTLPAYSEFRQLRVDLAKQATERERIEGLLRKAAGVVADSRRAIDRLEKEAKIVAYDAGRHLELKALLPVVKRRVDLQERVRAIESRAVSQRKLAAQALAATGELRKKLSAGAAELEAARGTAEKAASLWQTFRVQFGSCDRLLQAVREAEALVQSRTVQAALSEQIAERKKELAQASKDLKRIEADETKARSRVGELRAKVERLRALHAADEVRRRLQAGEPCPVCEQIVSRVPGSGRDHTEVDRADAELQNAEEAHSVLRLDVERKAQLVNETLPKQVASDEQRAAELERSVTAVGKHLEAIIGERGLKRDPVGSLRAKAASAKELEAEAVRCDAALRRASDQDVLLRRAAQDAESKAQLAEQALESTERELEERRRELAESPGVEADPARLQKEDSALDQARSRRESLQVELTAARRVGDKAEVDERAASERLALCLGNLAGLQDRLEVLEAQLGELTAEGVLERRRADAQKRLSTADQAMSALSAERDAMKKRAEESSELRDKVTLWSNTGEIHARLASLLRTDQFVAWILKDAFARLAYEGSRQLESLSNGRYTFAADSDDFAVCDRWNAGERRSVHTLSGGESFLASLSLALALSRSLPEFTGTERQRSRLDSLFLDEGFSTLDAETMNTVLEAVELLQADGRLVGVVSHAPELAERLPGRIEVIKSANGSRVTVR